MSISKPYYRIFRRNKNRTNTNNYECVKDKQYANNRVSLSRAYTNIERKLREIFYYIEPSDKNKDVYSIELYALLLRACTEVELNLKQILNSNSEARKNDRLNMNDYVRVEKSSRLSKYKLKYSNWRIDEETKEEEKKKCIVRYEEKILCPFEQFGIYSNEEFGQGVSPDPQWYSAYNAVKHNREINFRLATLDNCMNAVAGILVLLYSQFGPYCIETYNRKAFQCVTPENDYEPEFDADVIFEFFEWPEWTDDEKYDFDWEKLKKDSNPFDKFHFYKKEGNNS